MRLRTDFWAHDDRALVPSRSVAYPAAIPAFQDRFPQSSEVLLILPLERVAGCAKSERKHLRVSARAVHDPLTNALLCPCDVPVQSLTADAQLTGKSRPRLAGSHAATEFLCLRGCQRMLPPHVCPFAQLRQSDSLSLPFTNQVAFKLSECPMALRICLKTGDGDHVRHMRGGIEAIVWDHVPKRFAGWAVGRARAFAEGSARPASCRRPTAQV